MKFLKSYIKMERIIKCGEKFHQDKRPISIKTIDINKM